MVFKRRKDILVDRKDKGLFNYLYSSFGRDFVKVVKDYFNVSRKISKIKNDINFLLKCELEGVLPRFTRFRLTNRRLNGSESKRAFQKQIVESEIKAHKRSVRELKVKSKKFFDEINFKVFPIDWTFIKAKLQQHVSAFDQKTKKKQNEKLSDLTFDNRFSALEDELTNDISLSDDIFNLSNVKLSEKDNKLLG